MIRQYAVVHGGIVQVTVPEEYNEQEVEVQVILTKAVDNEPKQVTKQGGLGYLVGSLSHLSDEEKTRMDRELKELRDSRERDIL